MQITELENMKAALENFIEASKKMTERIEEIHAEQLDKTEKAKGVWFPNVGEEYFYKGSIDVLNIRFNGDDSDSSIIGKTRVYPTRQLAEANDCRKEKIAVWNKFREMETEAVDWEDDEQNKFTPQYENAAMRFVCLRWSTTQVNPEHEWYTTSANACEWVIANMQTELKKIWRV